MATPRIQSVNRAFSLLESLAKAGGSQSLPMMAAQCGLTVATAHRLLSTLETLGVVIHTGPGEYRIGMGLVDLARGATREGLLGAAAEPVLRRIVQALGFGAHVGVLDDDFMVTYIAKQTRKSQSIPTRIGSQLEAYCSGLGKVLLAALPSPQRMRYLSEGPFVALTEKTITDPLSLERELEKVARQGYAVDDCEIFDDLRCVAVPIMGRDGQVVAALSSSGAASDLLPGRVPQVVDYLREQAELIATKLYPRQASPASSTH